MERTIKLNEKDVIFIMAKHFKLKVENITFCQNTGILNFGPFIVNYKENRLKNVLIY